MFGSTFLLPVYLQIHWLHRLAAGSVFSAVGSPGLIRQWQVSHRQN